MCADPGTLAVLQLVASGAQAAMQFQAQQDAANAQDAANEIQRKQLMQEREQARMDAERQSQQQYEQSAAEVNQYAAQARRDMASFDALLGEGAGGVTAARKVAAIGIQDGQDYATLAANSTKAQAEIGLNERASINATNQKIAAIRPADRPSLLGTALQIGGAGIKYGMQKHQINNPKSPIAKWD